MVCALLNTCDIVNEEISYSTSRNNILTGCKRPSRTRMQDGTCAMRRILAFLGTFTDFLSKKPREGRSRRLRAHAKRLIQSRLAERYSQTTPYSVIYRRHIPRFLALIAHPNPKDSALGSIFSVHSWLSIYPLIHRYPEH